jgi:parallel beta-helix repeat protein
MISVNSIATLLTINPATSNEAYVEGYYTAGDLGGGEFYFDSSSSATPNNGTIFQSSYTSVGRWYRVLNGTRVNARWFGASGNGSTNDTSALQAAFDYCGANGLGLYISKGTYIVSSIGSSNFCLMVKYSNTFIEGDGFESEIKGASSSPNAGLIILQAISGQIQNVTVRNLNLNGNKSNQSGTWSQKCITVYCLTTTSSDPLNVTLEGLYCHDAYSNTINVEAGGISVLGDDFAYTLQNYPTQNIIIKGCFCWNNVGWGIGTNFSNGIIITGNVCWNNDSQGITLWNTQDSIVNGNRTYSNGSIGINLEISDRITVSDNSVSSSQLSAIRIYNSVDVIADSNICELNASYYLYFGIGLSSGIGYNSGTYKTRPCQKVIISNNNIRSIGSNGYAMSITTDAGYTNNNSISITDNQIYNTITGKALTATSDNITIANNRISGTIYSESSSGYVTIDSNYISFLNSPSAFNLITIGNCVKLIIKGNILYANQNGNDAVALTQAISKSILFDNNWYGYSYLYQLYGGATTPTLRDNLNW